MNQTATPLSAGHLLPARRTDLVIGPPGEDGQHVVKDPRTREYFGLGPEESFLLLGLDGAATGDSLRADYERRFGRALSAAELNEFLDIARTSGFLGGEAQPAVTVAAPQVGVAPAAPKSQAPARPPAASATPSNPAQRIPAAATRPPTATNTATATA